MFSVLKDLVGLGDSDEGGIGGLGAVYCPATQVIEDRELKRWRRKTVGKKLVSSCSNSSKEFSKSDLPHKYRILKEHERMAGTYNEKRFNFFVDECKIVQSVMRG